MAKLLRKTSVTVSATTLGLAFIASSFAGPPLSQTIDLRIKRDASVRYVVFCSRDSPRPNITGHAFVVYGKDDDEEKVCKVEDAFGFYPKDGRLGILSTVPGEVASEFVRRKGPKNQDLAWSCRLVVKVDDKQFEAAEAVRRKWAERGEYKMASKDCVGYVDEVAKAIGISTRPDRSDALLPETYIRKLTEGSR
jgi:hypothetical protein